ncbi:helix-turn-helix domain-containing protein [Rhodococcus sp. IEGM 1351]|uniref:helix-turn-helix domain-containing protein n=1 Tax=Rhodococcus sp. IEGM 1351 TaxID=3047089 RepID=UPI0024B63C9B|nr:helix-turn-helix domain-containing protein [Rhodococcus sp. IEGM 1351]MDI9934732.1 helix-turn-helix domain-containing protein [Rhodococcus sp. IEGM 1351]
MTALANKTLDDLVTEQDEKRQHDPSSQCAKILRLFKRRGFATNVELNSMGIFRYSARIKDLRDDGYLIETVRVHDGLYRFEFHGHRDEEVSA